jgi:hypothetical protein
MHVRSLLQYPRRYYFAGMRRSSRATVANEAADAKLRSRTLTAPMEMAAVGSTADTQPLVEGSAMHVNSVVSLAGEKKQEAATSSSSGATAGAATSSSSGATAGMRLAAVGANIGLQNARWAKINKLKGGAKCKALAKFRKDAETIAESMVGCNCSEFRY